MCRAGRGGTAALPPLSVSESIELLGSGIDTERLGPDPAAARSVVEVCGRLPIAIRVVNRRLASIPGCTVTDLLRDLDRAGGPDPETACEVPASSSFDLSCRQQEPASARVFHGASLIPGETFSAAAVGALTGELPAEIDRTLRGLVQENLVQRAPAG